jgi:hypothetical protein
LIDYAYLLTDGDVNRVAGTRLLKKLCGLESNAIRPIVRGDRKGLRTSIRELLNNLEQEAQCAPSLLEKWLKGYPAEGLRCIRIAVRAIESWVMADTEGLGKFLGVDPKRIEKEWRNSGKPDFIDFPKDFLVQRVIPLSPKNEIRNSMIPGENERVGKGYNNQLRRFLSEFWDPVKGAKNSPSLKSALKRIRKAFMEGKK